MSKYQFEFNTKVIHIDIDDANPACKNDPHVRIWLDNKICYESDEEYNEILAKEEIIGKKSEVFPRKIKRYDAYMAILKYKPRSVVHEIQDWIFKVGNKDISDMSRELFISLPRYANIIKEQDEKEFQMKIAKERAFEYMTSLDA